MTAQADPQANRKITLYESYLAFKDDIAIPWLREIWHLQIPAFSAALSIVFFAYIDQTLEVYRVFALNPSSLYVRIFSSFIFIFLLSLSIWYSGRALSKQSREEYAQYEKEVFCSKALHSIDKASKWLPRIFGFSPLLALGFGLFRAMNITTGGRDLIFPSLFVAVVIITVLLPSYHLGFFIFLVSLIIVISSPFFLKREPTCLADCSTNVGELLHWPYLRLGIVIVILLTSTFFIRSIIEQKRLGLLTQTRSPDRLRALTYKEFSSP